MPDLVDYAALGVIVLLSGSVAFGIEGPVRAVLALVFVTFVPGWAILTNWPAAARSSVVALSVLLSLAISTAVATVTLWPWFRYNQIQSRICWPVGLSEFHSDDEFDPNAV